MLAAKPLTVVMIGAGDRGKDGYGRDALDHPNTLHHLSVGVAYQGAPLRAGSRRDPGRH